MEHGQVVFGLFGPPNEQVAEAVEPGVRPLDDPAPSLLARFFGLGFFAPRPDVGRVAQRAHHFSHLVVIVARVQAHVLVVAGRPVGIAGGLSCGGQATQGAFRQLHVVPVRPLQHQPHRDSSRLGQQAALDATFAAVRGVGARFFPRPAALCAASRRGPSRQSSAQSSRRSPVRPRLIVG